MTDKGFMSDFNPIFEITNKFTFFAKFPTSYRQKIIAKSRLIVYDKGEIIFKQGDPSPDIFFMVRGTCAIKFQKPEWGSIEVCILTVYDGQIFGEIFEDEINQGTTKQKLDLQKNTAIANEECYVLAINKKDYKVALEQISDLKDGVDGQTNILKFLRSIDLFASIEDKIMLPVANNIKPKRYTFG